MFEEAAESLSAPKLPLRGPRSGIRASRSRAPGAVAPNMLHGQMRAGKTRNAGVSIPTPVGPLTASVGSTTNPSREAKLNAVVEELEEQHLVGTLAEPKDYFKDIMAMRWGLYDDCESRPEDEPALVYFGGFDKTEPLIVGLGGSSRHVVGHEGAPSTYSRSYTHSLVKWLLSGVHDNAPQDFPERWDMKNEEHSVLSAVGIALHYLRPPTQNLEFFAKTLMTGQLHGLEHLTGVPSVRVILGTPLYVAQAHTLPDEQRSGLDSQW